MVRQRGGGVSPGRPGLDVPRVGVHWDLGANPDTPRERDGRGGGAVGVRRPARGTFVWPSRSAVHAVHVCSHIQVCERWVVPARHEMRVLSAPPFPGSRHPPAALSVARSTAEGLISTAARRRRCPRWRVGRRSRRSVRTRAPPHRRRARRTRSAGTRARTGPRT